MAVPKLSEADFIHLFETIGPSEVARRSGATESGVYRRRVSLERKLGRDLVAPGNVAQKTRMEPTKRYEGRLTHEIMDGVILIGSDAHYWPGVVTTAHRAFVAFCKKLKPQVVVCNGDIFDGASVSRHSSIMWEEKPTVIQELEVCQERLGEIEKAAFKARKVWPIGNHDARFESRIAQLAPEYANVKGVHLKDHFPGWEPCWAIWINDEVVIKHRLKGGIHATHNNTMWAGKTIVTSHLHGAKTTPFTDYNGTRWGVDTGTLADPFGPQFEYIEDGPRNWRAGFSVLTFRGGRLMQPEYVLVVGDGEVDFRGELIKVP